MRTLRTTALALLLVLVPLAACGDDDDGGDGGGTGGETSGETSGEALSKAEFIEQGDDICQAAIDGGEDLEQPAQQDAEDLSRYLGEAVDVLDTAREDFAALRPPADGEEVYDLQVQALEDSVDILEEAKAKSDDGDIQGAAQVVGAADPEAQSRGPLQDYGFKVCGKE